MSPTDKESEERGYKSWFYGLDCEIIKNLVDLTAQMIIVSMPEGGNSFARLKAIQGYDYSWSDFLCNLH